MSQFARKALHRMGRIVEALNPYLGPGTSDLSMRIGLHSGPIMAGVLRGDKTRFQLFGDTMVSAHIPWPDISFTTNALTIRKEHCGENRVLR